MPLKNLTIFSPIFMPYLIVEAPFMSPEIRTKQTFVAMLVVIPGGADCTSTEKPVEFVQTVSDFLSNLK